MAEALGHATEAEGRLRSDNPNPRIFVNLGVSMRKSSYRRCRVPHPPLLFATYFGIKPQFFEAIYRQMAGSDEERNPYWIGDMLTDC